jgi:hypothetical protein
MSDLEFCFGQNPVEWLAAYLIKNNPQKSGSSMGSASASGATS